MSPEDLFTGEEQYRSLTRNLPRFSREEEADIVQRARSGDPDAREKLITSCLNYVGFIANRYKRLRSMTYFPHFRNAS